MDTKVKELVTWYICSYGYLTVWYLLSGDYLGSYTTYLIDTLVEFNVISLKIVQGMTCINISQ